jgi:SSS family transporter
MKLELLDWAIIIGFFAIYLSIGYFVSKNSYKSSEDFFLSGRNMPWWLLGVSMVATTFSADTPNLVTGLVREQGVAGNWGWWAFLLTGMLTTFVYAKLWRRSKVLTDIEFYELRYSGKPAAFLRGFRALYLGLIFNVLVMGTVSLAAIKFGEIMLGIPGWLTLLITGAITLAYSTMGGLKAVILTDFVQFTIAMIGSIWACWYILDLEQVGGLTNLLQNEDVISKMSFLPDFSEPSNWIPILLVPLAVQWWASYYPGAEPGGGGYIAQRMFSAKDEKNAMSATLFFNIAHYALRPWPWILIALASLIVYPNLSDLQSAFPNLPTDKLGHDVAYPAMLTLLPTGLLGLVAASLIAAFMSTMSTQLNLGASYLVNDLYKRFIKPEANEKELVKAGRIFSVVSMLLGLGLGLVLTDATQAFNILLLLGAGTGAIYIIRWFWWRINAYTEIIAMIASLVFAIYFTFIHDQLGMGEIEAWQKTVLGAVLTTITWIIATYLTPKTNNATLREFYIKIKPSGIGWDKVIKDAELDGVIIKKENGQFPLELLGMVTGCITVFSALFTTGFLLYSEDTKAIIFGAITIAGSYLLIKITSKLKFL